MSIIQSISRTSRRLISSHSIRSLNQLHNNSASFSSASTIPNVTHNKSFLNKFNCLIESQPKYSTTAEIQQGEPDRLLQKLEIKCQSNERAVIKSYGFFLELACKHLDLDLAPIDYPRVTKQRMTLLKSVFVHKKHRVQYEMRTYHLHATIFHVTGSTADTFVEYAQRMCPEGVAMHVTEHQLKNFSEPIQKQLKEQSIAEEKEKTTQISWRPSPCVENYKVLWIIIAFMFHMKICREL